MKKWGIRDYLKSFQSENLWITWQTVYQGLLSGV